MNFLQMVFSTLERTDFVAWHVFDICSCLATRLRRKNLVLDFLSFILKYPNNIGSAVPLILQ